MSSQKVNQLTMKLKDIDPEQIYVENVKMKNGDVIPLVKYGPDKQTLNVQFAGIKLRQYGLQPGETLSNGKKNDYYQGEDARLSLRIPFDPKCCVGTNSEDDNETNEDTIKTEAEILKKIDARIKNVFCSVAGVDADDKEKYNPILRKPAKSKPVKGKHHQEEKEKYNFVKCKFDTDGDAGDKRILTKFYKVDEDRKALLLNDNESKVIKMEDVEKLVTYNSEVTVMAQFSKVWMQSTGAWGVTLKLKLLRVKQTSYTVREDAQFLNSDDESSTKVSALKTAPAKVMAWAKVEEDYDSEQESNDEPAPVQTKVAHKKAVAIVESSDDDESDEEVKPAKKSAKVPAKAVVTSKLKKTSV